MAKGILGFFFGNTPKVPDYKPVQPGVVQQETIAGNAAALPGAESLASNVNQFNLNELAKALQFSLPGGLEKAQTNISNQLLGIADVADTKAAIKNATAANYGRGTAAGQFGGLNVIGQLGRSVGAQRQQGLTNFLGLAQATRAPQMDASSMFFTPQQRLTAAMTQNENQFNRDWLSNQIQAAPNPAGAFTTQLILTLAGNASKALGAVI